MKRLYIIFSIISVHLFSQTNLTVDSFYLIQTKRPDNYQSLIFDSKGWTFGGEYFLDNKSINTKRQKDNVSSINTVFYTKTNTPYKGVYYKVKGNKIFFHGDKRGHSTSKIIYIDEHLLIVEGKVYKEGKIKRKKRRSHIIELHTLVYRTESRIIYRR